MDLDIILRASEPQRRAVLAELEACNHLTLPYGLSLTETQMQALAAHRLEALQAAGRVEFGAGVTKKLILAFRDSPYLDQTNYEDTLMQLQDAFNYFKNESKERLTDDGLIAYMRAAFDGPAQGSLDYLNGTALEELCRWARESGAAL